MTTTGLETSKKGNADAKPLLESFSLTFPQRPSNTWKEARRIVKRDLEATKGRDIRRLLFKGFSHVARTRSLGAGKDYLQNLYTQDFSGSSQIKSLTSSRFYQMNGNAIEYMMPSMCLRISLWFKIKHKRWQAVHFHAQADPFLGLGTNEGSPDKAPGLAQSGLDHCSL